MDLFSSDAIINYIAEFFGIIITVIIIPIVLNLYFKRKNRFKKHIADEILMKRIYHYLKIIVPEQYRISKNEFWKKKGSLGLFDYYIPFDIIDNFEMQIRKDYIAHDLDEYILRVWSVLNDFKKESWEFSSIYSDVIDKSISREFLLIERSLAAIEENIYDLSDFDIEDISIAVYSIIRIRTILLKKCKIVTNLPNFSNFE
jgi:hypothetical protein